MPASSSPTKLPRYFLDLPEDRVARPWDPHAGARPERPDTRYFAGVFREMEPLLRDPEIEVHLTWDGERLPSYGSRVVAVLLRDDGGRLPRYVDRVKAVFKCYGTNPTLGTGPFRNPGITGLTELAQYGLRWARWLPGGFAHARMRALRRRRGLPPPAPVSTIPLGTFNQLDLPFLPMSQRPTDVFFAGSVEHGASLRRRMTPKTRARREMLSAVRALRLSCPELRIDVRVTSGFQASAEASALAYSRGLMDARVCLAPRGTSVETFRVLEGLRAGCVVVSERLPNHWFYRGAPLLQVDNWGQLDAVLAPIFAESTGMERFQAQARTWWRERCSEAAIGRFLAERLNALDLGS